MNGINGVIYTVKPLIIPLGLYSLRLSDILRAAAGIHLVT